MHSDNDAGYTVHCNDLKWLPLAPAVYIKVIKLVPETGEYTIMSAEIYVMKGRGAHPQTGHFVAGDYVSEHKGALHDPLLFDYETELLMVSRGPSVFLADDGSDLYTMDVAMLQRMNEAAA
ncbi:hypothetical protein BJX63DRAFT_421196 [Aspergillus granulosus]|uniref:ChrR-like cupin domain-containing protein n=1 Tax=Aspergillus granulosus TaxID=176169 RepID=A0ABR4HFL9_9EURO